MLMNKASRFFCKNEKSNKKLSVIFDLNPKLKYDTIYISWVAMIFSIIIWFKFDSSINTGELGNTRNYYRIILVIIAGIFAVLHAIKYSRDLRYAANPPFNMLLIYGFIALVSSVLVPMNSFYTMWKAIEIIIDVTAILGIIACTKSPNGAITAFKWLMAYNLMMIIFISAGAIFNPSEAFRPSRGLVPYFLQGTFPISNPNSVGFISVQLVIHSMANYFRTERSRSKYFWMNVLFISLIALVLAQSRTSIAGLIAGLIIYLMLDRKTSIAISFVLIGTVVLILTSGLDIVESYLLRGQSEELVKTLSGRTHGWAAAWELFMQSPWIGHGFAAAARTQILAGQNASTLHGAFFDVIVGVGLIGLIPWLVAIILMLAKMTKLTLNLSKWARNKYERSIHAEMAAMTAILLIRSATSSGIAMHEHAFMLLLCIIGYSYMMHKQIKVRHKTAYRSTV